MIKYSLCVFEYGYVGSFYQVIDNDQVSFLNLDGTALDLIPPYGYNVIEDESSPIFL